MFRPDLKFNAIKNRSRGDPLFVFGVSNFPALRFEWPQDTAEMTFYLRFNEQTKETEAYSMTESHDRQKCDRIQKIVETNSVS